MGPHLAMVAIGLGSLALTFRLLRESFPVALALAGVALIAVNPLLVHNTPFVYADVASMGLTALCLWLAVRSTQRPTAATVAGLAASLALGGLLKYPLFVLPGAVLAADLAHRLGGNLREAREAAADPEAWSDRRTSLLGFVTRPWLPLAAVAAGPLVVLGLMAIRARIAPGEPNDYQHAIEPVRTALTGSTYAVDDPPTELAEALWTLWGKAVVLTGALGTLRALWRRSFADVLHAGWGLGFVAIMSLKIAHHEARYLLPALPSLAYLVLSGAQWLVAGLEWLLRDSPLAPGLPPARGGRPAGVLAGLLAAMLLVPTVQGVREAQYFRDPVYTQPLFPELARWIRERTGPEDPIIASPWIRGNTFFVYCTWARSPVVLPHDEYWHFHYLNQNGLSWYFDKMVRRMEVVGSWAPRSAIDGTLPFWVVQVPQRWGALPPEALWLEAVPTRAVVLQTAQGWWEGSTVAQAPEPPLPIVATAYQHTRLVRQPDGSYVDSTGAQRMTPTRVDGRWGLPVPAGVSVWVRAADTEPPLPLAQAGEELPQLLELLKVDRAEFKAR